MAEVLRQRWVLSPVRAAEADLPPGAELRGTSPVDDQELALLLRDCYAGTVDFDAAHDFGGELAAWRELDAGDDAASAVALWAGDLVGACLIGIELGSPLLYEIAVALGRRWAGLGRALLAASLRPMANRQEDLVAAWVTVGNLASEALLGSTGFVPVGPRMDRAARIAHYHAGLAAQRLGLGGALAVATELTSDGAPLLWIITPEVVRGGEIEEQGTTVRLVYLAPDDPGVSRVARDAVPIWGASWLLERRCPSAGP